MHFWIWKFNLGNNNTELLPCIKKTITAENFITITSRPKTAIIYFVVKFQIDILEHLGKVGWRQKQKTYNMSYRQKFQQAKLNRFVNINGYIWIWYYIQAALSCKVIWYTYPPSYHASTLIQQMTSCRAMYSIDLIVCSQRIKLIP